MGVLEGCWERGFFLAPGASFARLLQGPVVSSRAGVPSAGSFPGTSQEWPVLEPHRRLHSRARDGAPPLGGLPRPPTGQLCWEPIHGELAHGELVSIVSPGCPDELVSSEVWISALGGRQLLPGRSASAQGDSCSPRLLLLFSTHLLLADSLLLQLC